MFTELFIFYCMNYIIKVALTKLLEELITINKGERIKNYNIQKKKNRKILNIF